MRFLRGIVILAIIFLMGTSAGCSMSSNGPEQTVSKFYGAIESGSTEDAALCIATPERGFAVMSLGNLSYYGGVKLSGMSYSVVSQSEREAIVGVQGSTSEGKSLNGNVSLLKEGDEWLITGMPPLPW